MEGLESQRHRSISPRPLESLASAGFSEAAIARLLAVRTRYQNGDFSEKTIETKRLEFARWLREQGQIAE